MTKLLNQPDVTIDIETLATTPDALILSIAAIKFDAFQNYTRKKIAIDDLETLHCLIQIEGQDRETNEETVKWWSQQNSTVVEHVFSETGRLPLEEALELLRKFTWNARRIWCQGTDFDITILRHAYSQFGKVLPWDYWRARDSRTLLDLVEVELPRATHDALEDCYRQIVGVQWALERLGITHYVR